MKYKILVVDDDKELVKMLCSYFNMKQYETTTATDGMEAVSYTHLDVYKRQMYGNVNRKKKKDGTLYKDYFYYACKHRRLVDGHKCGYRKQWSEDKINNAVEEVIRKLVRNPKFEEAILNKIGSRIDTEEIEKEIEGLEKQHRQLTGAKARLGQQMDLSLIHI